MGHQTKAGFMTEDDIFKAFATDLKGKLEPQWYSPDDHSKQGHRHELTYGHNEKIKPGDHFDCDLLVDEWYKWFLTTPVSSNSDGSRAGWYADRNSYGDRNVFSFNKRNTFAYFIASAPFQDPFDVRRAIITREAPLLVPLYNVCAAREECPTYDDDRLNDLVLKDLKGIRENSVEVLFDGEDRKDKDGCMVVRNKEPLEISNVPEENVLGIPKERLQESNHTIHVFHGGFWLLIRESELKAGDHLLLFKARSKNYEMSAKIIITVLV
jgi:hypothetical protein